MHDLSPRRIFLLRPPPPAALAIGLCCVLASSPAATAQSTAPPSNSAPGQTIGPAFEVATVRLADSNDGRRWFGIQVTSSGRLTASAVSLSSLVHFAYQSPDEVAKTEGEPPWAKSDKFDINGKIDDAQMAGWESLSNRERMERARPMLRELLQKRFALKLHTEMRPTAVYALVQVKSGAKLKPAAPPDDTLSFADIAKRDQAGVPLKAPPGGTMMTGDSWMGSAVKPSQIMGQIGFSSHINDLVVDETGLTGYYDFTMTVDHDKDAPLFQDQVEQQLGLRLVPKKMPIKTWVIDSAEKPSVDGS